MEQFFGIYRGVDFTKEANMNVAIKSVTLNNFKCYTQQTIDFAGADAIISGRNGIGKSTIIDAIVWCFTGKLPNAKAEGASIRPVGEPKCGYALCASARISTSTLRSKRIRPLQPLCKPFSEQFFHKPCR